MEVKERYSYWIDLADYDLEKAKAMLKTKRFHYVGFIDKRTYPLNIEARYPRSKEELVKILNLKNGKVF